MKTLKEESSRKQNEMGKTGRNISVFGYFHDKIHNHMKKESIALVIEHNPEAYQQGM